MELRFAPLGLGELFRLILKDQRKARGAFCAAAQRPPAARALPWTREGPLGPFETRYYACSASNFFMKSTSFFTPSTGMAL